MGEPGTKEPLTLEELEASAGVRTGRKHILSILVENKPGVLTRISGLFARRGFNIDTLAVGPTDDERLSRITLTLDGAMHPIDQVTKQLHKLVNVIKIRDLEPTETVARELALFKISADGAWIGWTGVADRELDPFEHDGISIIPVPLSSDELEEYYEGFSNDTLWPLYHDVIAPPSFHREWWEAYVRVNRRFAEAAARAASDGAVVWVQDYQLRFTGRIRSGPDTPWMSFEARQRSVVEAPLRLFLMHARMRGLPVQAFHRYEGGRATMRVRLGGVIPVADAAGDVMDVSETVTVLNDMCLLAPATLLDPRIAWTARDDRSALARFTVNAHTVSATLYFGEDGLLTNFVSKKGRKFKAFLVKTPQNKVGFEFLPRAEKPAKATAAPAAATPAATPSAKEKPARRPAARKKKS